MIIKFKEASFLLGDYNGARTDGKTLYIYVGKKTFDLDFSTKAEAAAAHDELVELINKHLGKTTQDAPETSSLFDELKGAGDVINAVSSVVRGFAERVDQFTTKQVSKAKEAAVNAAVNKVQDTIEKRVETLADSLGTVLDGLFSKLSETNSEGTDSDTSTKEKPVDKQKSTGSKPVANKRHSLLDGLDIFGSHAKPQTVKVEVTDLPLYRDVAGTPEEPLIGDLTEEQVEEYIDDFMQDVLSNERVQDMFQSILSNFSSEKAADALSGYKKVVLTIALQHPDLTLTQVLKSYFM